MYLLQYSRHLIYFLWPNVWKASYTISAFILDDVRYWLPYSTDKFIFCFVPGPSQWFFSLWRRDRNSMESYRVSTLDVPESPIATGARGAWLCNCNCNLYFNGRQHLRSLTLVMNDFWCDGQWYPGMVVAEIFLTYVLRLRKNPGQTSTRKTDPIGDRIRAR